ncbi:sensor histidine kinase [Paenibacillus sp. NFR01]|uniref:sensor histidine kinase n=1 Tax=Paenibacillus sp. NFR01 TaxID=1566279 RepID=UPI0008CE1994|nr:sensor histidine kinase [Paenibacillus sp. NFR01]SET88210.1 two-component system, sensor histidine kinase YesM [Paenibacillus sp. NFR01]
MVSRILRFFRWSWQYLANLPMEKKLIVIFIFLLSLPISFVSYLSAQATYNSNLRNAANNAVQLTANAADTIDRYIADLKRSTLLPLYNTDVQYYLEQKVTDWDKNVSMSMFLGYLKITKDEISTVYLVDKYGNVFYDRAGGISVVSTTDQIERWRSLLAQAGTSPVLEGRHSVIYNLDQKKEVFSMLRTIKSTSRLDDIGMIIFDIDVSMLLDVLGPVNAVAKGTSMVVDDHNQIVYATNGEPQKHLDLLLARRSGSSGSFQYADHGERYLVAYHKSEQTGWITSVNIPLNPILSGIRHTRDRQLLTTLAILMFALIVATLFSHALTKPLKSLVRLMKKVQHGNLNVWLEPKYNDEIGMLGSHFNRMIIRVKELLTEVAETEQRKQKADMLALQNQINPHFFYNTLESIRMLAEGSDDSRVAKLTYMLGLQMRYSITRSDKAVTVRQELEHVTNYYNLLQIRFPEKFRLIIDVPEEYLQLPMLKLVFQPIVENAVFHGLEPKIGIGTISITASRDGEAMLFTVTDDGVGMDAGTLEELRASLKHGTFTEFAAEESRFGIGLHNVNDRLRLNYGPGSGLLVDSQAGVGTSVTLRILLLQLGGIPHAEHPDR